MSGMVKAKKYDWKDSNLALFGSDTDKKVKKESAATEPAWQGAGQEVGLQIWRIVKFKVTHWDKEDYGKFYNGDSYIILNTYKKPGSDELLQDVHFWIGKYSTQDEYGTAAYKTVELDTLLDDKPVQHREVQGNESKLFKSYFDNLSLLKGGADTGFRHVEPRSYEPRLLRLRKEGRTVIYKELPLHRGFVTEDDVFILDKGLHLIQYNGANASKDEKFKAAQYVQKIESERGGKPKSEVLEGGSVAENHPFFTSLVGTDDEPEDDVDGDKGPSCLYRLSDEGGSLNMTKVKEDNITKEDFNSSDVFLLDTTEECFVWVGKGASIDERKNALTYAHNHLMKTSHPLIPVTVLNEGREVDSFESALAA